MVVQRLRVLDPANISEHDHVPRTVPGPVHTTEGDEMLPLPGRVFQQ